MSQRETTYGDLLARCQILSEHEALHWIEELLLADVHHALFYRHSILTAPLAARPLRRKSSMKSLSWSPAPWTATMSASLRTARPVSFVILWTE